MNPNREKQTKPFKWAEISAEIIESIFLKHGRPRSRNTIAVNLITWWKLIAEGNQNTVIYISSYYKVRQVIALCQLYLHNTMTFWQNLPTEIHPKAEFTCFPHQNKIILLKFLQTFQRFIYNVKPYWHSTAVNKATSHRNMKQSINFLVPRHKNKNNLRKSSMQHMEFHSIQYFYFWTVVQHLTKKIMMSFITGKLK